MTKSRVLVLVIEGLGTNLLGPYGANLARTPTLDQMAVEGFVLDQCFVDSVERPAQRESLWFGTHAANVAASNGDLTSVWQQCERAGIASCLWTDSKEVAQHAEQAGCREATLVPVDKKKQPATATEACECLSLFSAVSDFISSDQEAELVWVHSQGLTLPWDAPLDLRANFVDPEDPDPPAECEVPTIPIRPDTDPDLIVGWGQVAAAQVTVIDEGVAALLASLESRSDFEQWSWLVTSLGGMAMGEQDWFGQREREHQGFLGLHGQELQTATLLHLAGVEGGIGLRHQPLCQLPDLAATICELLGLASEDPNGASRWGQSLIAPLNSKQYNGFPSEWPASHQVALVCDRVMATSWIACPAWSAVLDGDGGPSTRLFVKPEDRWEVNNVANLRRDVLEELETAADEFQRALTLNDRQAMKQLSESLTNLIR